MKKGFNLLIACAVLVLMVACGGKQDSSVSQSQSSIVADEQIMQDDQTQVQTEEQPQQDKTSVDENNAESKIIVIDFFATWCGPCKLMAPSMEKMQEKYGDKVVIRKIDIDEEPALAQQYQVQSIPTLVVISPSGEVIDKIIGAQPIEALDEMFAKLASTKVE